MSSNAPGSSGPIFAPAPKIVWQCAQVCEKSARPCDGSPLAIMAGVSKAFKRAISFCLSAAGVRTEPQFFASHSSIALSFKSCNCRAIGTEISDFAIVF